MDFIASEINRSLPPDNVLLSVARVLIAGHRLFFQNFDKPLLDNFVASSNNDQLTGVLPSTRTILSQMRRTVLASTCILFSGIFPLGKPPMAFAEFLFAQKFGSVIAGLKLYSKIAHADDVTENVTHVIAGLPDSLKVHKALNLKKPAHVVNCNWLYHCITHYQISDEQYFPLIKKNKSGSSIASNNEHSLISVQMETTSHPSRPSYSHPTASSDGRLPAPINDFVCFTSRLVEPDDLVSKVSASLGKIFAEQYARAHQSMIQNSTKVAVMQESTPDSMLKKRKSPANGANENFEEMSDDSDFLKMIEEAFE